MTGLSFDNGVSIVVKAYQPRWTRSFLAGVRVVQGRLHDAGLPCAKPLGGPFPCGLGQATVESHVAEPGQPDSFGDPERRASAIGLGQVIAAAGMDRRLAGQPMAWPTSTLYPKPHSPLFELETTAEPAAWIDELAALAHSNLDRTPRVVAHTDWSARNVRLRPDRVAAIYDLDSLGAVSLPTALGQAAATWRALGEADEPSAPDVEEIHAWIDEYPALLTGSERKAAVAAALLTLSYTARCEMAVDPAGTRIRRASSALRKEAKRFRAELS